MTIVEDRCVVGNSEWARTWCCGMPYPTDADLSVELLRHPSGPVVHRLGSYCIEHRPHITSDGNLADCLTCGDTGLVIRQAGRRSSLCPSHCRWAWHRLERAMR